MRDGDFIWQGDRVRVTFPGQCRFTGSVAGFTKHKVIVHRDDDGSEAAYPFQNVEQINDRP